MDLILSSGFLAFARHLGVLQAVERRGIAIEALVGTSSGALVGALAQAGHSLDRISTLLSERAPLYYMRPHAKPWQGLCTMGPLKRILQALLPGTFEELPKPFAVGVRDETGEHRLLSEGDLLSAVMASIAIPYVFPPVVRGEHRYADGGVTDRTGVAAWHNWRPGRAAIVHIVERTRGQEVPFDTAGMWVLRTPRSNAKFWSLGEFARQKAEACALASDQLLQHAERN